MPWNWELPDWPHFRYSSESITHLEREFLLGEGGAGAYLKSIEKGDYTSFIVEILSDEGVESSRIEGEVLDRESLQISIQRQFGLQVAERRGAEKEARMAALLSDVYSTFSEPLTHAMLKKWHEVLFPKSGGYRTHEEPMQIVSSRSDRTTIFFEAPPSGRVESEMERFIDWFNATNDGESILARSALAHVYFESIHPFEDGNGRIGRLLTEKILSQGVGRPILVTISKMLEKRKKEYYASLEQCNRTLEVQKWVDFFASVIVESQKESMQLLHFLLSKSKMLHSLEGKINERQLKVLLKLFACGPRGFQGGLSAENYIAITRASRATATRDLVDLMHKGALIKTGERRHTRYWLRLDAFS